MTSSECDLCGSTDFQRLSDTDRRGQPLSTVLCKCCGLVRHASIPSEAQLSAFYATDYRKAYHGERTPGARRIMRAWKNGERICRRIAAFLRPGCRVLEVGAGIGCTVKVFEQAGFLAEGIDPGGEFLKFSRRHLQANVHVNTLENLPGHQRCDVVLLVHVIEHLRSPRAALQHISGLLGPGGMLYVECPNLQAPFARRHALFHSAHLHNFVPATLQMLAEACGYELRHRFGDEQDPNLQMLFEFTGNCRLRIDEENFQRTVVQLSRADFVPYFFRRRYITDRIRKLCSYAAEYIFARSFVRRLTGKFHAPDHRNPERHPGALGFLKTQ
jgi:2-polyprenyl-3-methyl-5-hydroxy-6-metoxy-1,4-benzoquinol methylase